MTVIALMTPLHFRGLPRLLLKLHACSKNAPVTTFGTQIHANVNLTASMLRSARWARLGTTKPVHALETVQELSAAKTFIQTLNSANVFAGSMRRTALTELFLMSQVALVFLDYAIKPSLASPDISGDKSFVSARLPAMLSTSALVASTGTFSSVVACQIQQTCRVRLS